MNYGSYTDVWGYGLVVVWESRRCLPSILFGNEYESDTVESLSPGFTRG